MRLLYYATILRLRLYCVLQSVAHFCATASIENAVFCNISQQKNNQTRGDHARMLCFAAFLKGQIAKAEVSQRRPRKGERGVPMEGFAIIEV